jgi:short-subunit dehydrogenase
MDNRAVVITGTSTGIGKPSALYLDKMGSQVPARWACRNAEIR